MILAAGAVSNDFGIPEVKEHGFGLYMCLCDQLQREIVALGLRETAAFGVEMMSPGVVAFSTCRLSYVAIPARRCERLR